MKKSFYKTLFWLWSWSVTGQRNCYQMWGLKYFCPGEQSVWVMFSASRDILFCLLINHSRWITIRQWDNKDIKCAVVLHTRHNTTKGICDERITLLRVYYLSINLRYLFFTLEFSFHLTFTPQHLRRKCFYWTTFHTKHMKSPLNMMLCYKWKCFTGHNSISALRDFTLKTHISLIKTYILLLK